MSWADLLIETDKPFVSPLIPDGSRFEVSGIDRFKVEPAIMGGERDEGRTVFFVPTLGSRYITPDEATAMGMALIKAAAQERAR